MKIWGIFWLLLFLLVFNPTCTFANEETRTKYFGVGATVEEVEQATFIVKTNGKKTGEGFVFSPEPFTFDKGKVSFQVSLEGNGTVFVKLVESDANGKLINEHTTPMILLSNDWKEYNLSASLNKATDQVDIFVITDGTQQTVFRFRDANLVE